MSEYPKLSITRLWELKHERIEYLVGRWNKERIKISDAKTDDEREKALVLQERLSSELMVILTDIIWHVKEPE